MSLLAFCIMVLLELCVVKDAMTSRGVTLSSARPCLSARYRGLCSSSFFSARSSTTMSVSSSAFSGIPRMQMIFLLEYCSNSNDAFPQRLDHTLCYQTIYVRNIRKHQRKSSCNKAANAQMCQTEHHRFDLNEKPISLLNAFFMSGSWSASSPRKECRGMSYSIISYFN